MSTDSEAEAELRLLEDAEAGPEAEDSCRLDSGSALSADMKQSGAGQREGERRHSVSCSSDHHTFISCSSVISSISIIISTFCMTEGTGTGHSIQHSVDIFFE